MKRTVLDAVVGYFDPVKGLKRMQARATMNNVKRKYELADKGRRGGWFNKTSAAQEVSAGHLDAASAAQDLCRNNPIALRAKRVWAASAVGAGVKLEISHVQGRSSAKNATKLNEIWDDWAESTYCDFEGHHDLYGLQHLWMNTIVESGGVFIRKHVNNALAMPLQLQTFEQDKLDNAKDVASSEDGTIVIDGIQFKNGQRTGYWLKTEPTNTNKGSIPESKFYKVDDILHIYLKDRAGQHLGISWFTSVGNTMKNYDTYQDAKLVQQQVAACFALIVEGAQSATDVNGKGQGTASMPDEIEPGMVEYVENGMVPHTITPPRADNSAAFDIGLKRDMAIGMGLTYEQLTGDYSLVNFASGRMGKTEFHSQLDTVQHLMLKPQLKNIFNWFGDINRIKAALKQGGAKGDKFKLDWTFPVRAAVSPKEEFEVLMAKVRHGMLSPQKACKMLGERLELVVTSWTEAKKLFGELPFDVDPSMFSAAGNQIDENDASSNQDVSSSEPANTAEEEAK